MEALLTAAFFLALFIAGCTDTFISPTDSDNHSHYRKKQK
jgi:hypothetical protein